MKTRIFLVFIWLFGVTVITCGTAGLQTGIISGNGVNLRNEPNLGSRVISVLQQGSPVTIMEHSELWYKVQLTDGRIGWVCQRFVELKPMAAINTRERFTTPQVKEMVSFARSLLGTKYIYGGRSLQGFDCSGFTMYVFSKFGFKLPHQAKLQMKTGEEVKTREELLPGDLVFFRTMGSSTVNHVGIYLGDNHFIHASSGSGAVRISPLDRGYYENRYAGGRRVIPLDGDI